MKLSYIILAVVIQISVAYSAYCCGLASARQDLVETAWRYFHICAEEKQGKSSIRLEPHYLMHWCSLPDGSSTGNGL